MRFEESRRELWSLLKGEKLADCPILVLGNKIDRSDPANSEEFILRYITASPNDWKGRNSAIGNEESASGVVHVFCSLAPGLHRRFPMAIPIHVEFRQYEIALTVIC